MNDTTTGGRPTGWMIAAAVCALAAIGLGIWAFTTKSDLDDANATIETQRAQLASQEGSAAKTEAQEEAITQRVHDAYDRVHRRLARTRQKAADLKAQVDKESGELEQAQREVADAKGGNEKLQAQVKEASEARDLAAACARGALDSINHFFQATSAQAGAEKAVKQLESLQEQCQQAVQS